MQAVILAGGLGTRLRPLTDKVPKVMVKVRGKEFLWYVVSWLRGNGVRDVVICAGRLYLRHGEFLYAYDIRAR